MNEEKIVTSAASGDWVHVTPEQLMEPISKLTFSRPLLISVLAHIAVIGVCSVGYLMNCYNYQTFNIKAAQAEERQLKRAEEEKAARERSMAEAAEEARKNQDAAAVIQASEAEKQAAKAKADAERREKSPTMQKINEVSNERPDAAALDIDSLLKN